MLPKPMRLQYPECVFNVPRVHPSKQVLVILWRVGRPLKEAFDDSLERHSVVRLAGFLDHRGLKHLQWMLLWQNPLKFY